MTDTFTAEEFVAKHGIEADVEHLGRHTEDGWTHDAYTITLTNARGGTFKTPYKCGIALGEPEAPEVIECFANDYRTQLTTFEDFAHEFGYDTDSRKAEAIFNAVREFQTNIRGWLTEEELADLELVED